MKLSNEAKIGIMVFLVLTSLAYLTFRSGDFRLKKEGYELKVHFNSIDGVDQNAPVRLNGMEVGLVKDIQIIYGDKTVMELTLHVNQGVRIHQGCKAFVKNLGLFGEKYIGLSIGDTSQDFLKPGATIVGEEAANLEKIMADGEVVAENLKEISIEVNERLKVNSEKIDEIFENIRISSNNITSITDNLKERLKVNEGRIDEMIENMNSASRNMDELSYDLKLNPWKLMYKETDKKAKKEKKPGSKILKIGE